MHFSDSAIILAKHNLKERSGYITVLTEEHGVCKGFVSYIVGKNSYIYQPGNIVKFDWQARLEDHMGRAKCDLLHSTSHVLSSKKKLYGLNSLLSIIKSSLKERIQYEYCFEILKNYVTETNASFSLKKYIGTEISILQELGYGLDLSSCAVTGSSENLSYVSPKSGRAVSFGSGQKYKDKLLRLPQFMIIDIEPENSMDVQDAANLLHYFYDRYIWHGKKLEARDMLIKECIRSLDR